MAGVKGTSTSPEEASRIANYIAERLGDLRKMVPPDHGEKAEKLINEIVEVLAELDGKRAKKETVLRLRKLMMERFQGLTLRPPR